MFKEGEEVIITVYPYTRESFSERGVVIHGDDADGKIEVKNNRFNYLYGKKRVVGWNNPDIRFGHYYDGTYKIEHLPVSVSFIKECNNG